MKKRLDQHLVDIGLAPSRTKAQELIERKQVIVNTQAALKPSQLIDTKATNINLTDENLLKYVSRAGFKLEEALIKFKISVKSVRALDIGQSTGGFTDCLLQQGAAHVVGVDVASDQLSKKLINHPQVTALFNINARELERYKGQIGENFEFVVIDVSFISLEKVLPQIPGFLKNKGQLLALIKPQFEVGYANLDKNGIVKSPREVDKTIDKIINLAHNLSLVAVQVRPVKMKGRDGNQEFFLYAKK